MIALAVACSLLGSGAFTAPSDVCTPGSAQALTRQEACVHKARPVLPPADRREILAAYSVPNWSGRDGELDHRVPFFLGGTTDAANIWPERGTIPNPKDKLEFYVYDRVCKGRPHPMRVSTARRIFLRDWRTAYRKYIR